MSEFCRACGKVIGMEDCIPSDVSNLCQSCKTEFQSIERTILAEGNEKYLKYCSYCGRPFTSFHYHTYCTGKKVKRLTKRKFCDLHYAQCVTCGKAIPFKSQSSWVPNSCSKECLNTMKLESFKSTCKEKYGVEFPAQSAVVQETRRQNCITKYGVDNVFKLKYFQDKAKQTCLERYGVEHAAQSEQIKEKSRRTYQANYGVGTPGYDELRSRKEATSLERYGVSNPMKSKEIQDKVQQTNLKLYGVPCSLQHPEVREKSIQTCLERYGVKYAMQNDDMKRRREATCIERYGVPHVLQDPEVKAKSYATKMERYGGIGFDSDILKSRAKQTCLERFGSENPNSTDVVLAAKRKTWMEHYGVDHPLKSPEVKERVRWARIEYHARTIEDPQLRQNYLEFSKDPVNYVMTHFDHKPSIIEVSETLGNVDPTSVSAHIPLEYHNLLGNYQSTMEREITAFLKEINPNINFVIHDRKEIYPFELDLYLPDYNFAIECDPTASHNSTINVFDPKSDPIDRNYHKDKSTRCTDRGIFLMHIFGYDWSTRQDVVKSMIRNRLGLSTCKYYARKLKVVDISHEDCITFLNNNHLQRGLTAPVRIGLLSENNELISVMTFNHIRHTMGKSISNFDSWELSRFCNLQNTNVVGGASKLFSYFIKKYTPQIIVSFSDIAHTTGKVYPILGFHKESVTEPSYVWVNLNSDIWYNRVSCQKQYLPKLFNEPDLDIKNKTEQMIMSEHGFVQVFDSGKIKWMWNAIEEVI